MSQMRLERENSNVQLTRHLQLQLYLNQRSNFERLRGSGQPQRGRGGADSGSGLGGRRCTFRYHSDSPPCSMHACSLSPSLTLRALRTQRHGDSAEGAGKMETIFLPGHTGGTVLSKQTYDLGSS